MPTIIETLDSLKKQAKKPLTEEIKRQLESIKKICDIKYFNQSFYGNSALNRKMLLDEEIAKSLTPEVLIYLFTNTPTLETKIKRNTSPGGVINLKDAIYYGFKEGLHVIRKMPNNEPNYSENAYIEQDRKFYSNTITIVSNISNAIGVDVKDINVEQDLNIVKLMDQYDRIVATINLLKASNKSGNLLKVSNYTPDQMRSQVQTGFRELCKLIQVSDLKNEKSLSEFCEKFLKNPKAMLNGSVVHLFYDRAHIEAALEQNTKYNIGGNKYTFQDIFREMVSKVSENPDKYPPCAKEQFCLRFDLVERDLMGRFENASSKIDINELRKVIGCYKAHLEKKLVDDGFIVTVNDNTEVKKLCEEKQNTEKQEKLLTRYRAIIELDKSIQGKESLETSDRISAKSALQTCLNNKPEWTERPFLQKLTDILSFGIIPLYRTFFSKETRLEEDLLTQVFPGLKSRP